MYADYVNYGDWNYGDYADGGYADAYPDCIYCDSSTGPWDYVYCDGGVFYCDGSM